MKMFGNFDAHLLLLKKNYWVYYQRINIYAVSVNFWDTIITIKLLIIGKLGFT